MGGVEAALTKVSIGEVEASMEEWVEGEEALMIKKIWGWALIMVGELMMEVLGGVKWEAQRETWETWGSSMGVAWEEVQVFHHRILQ